MTIIYFILILGITVFIHELGHFMFAKKYGVYVYEFSIGMGPKLFKFKRKNDETNYCIRLFPIGGFVQMAGEEVEVDENIPEEKRLQSKTAFQRFMIMVAGVMMNFLLAIILLFLIGLFNSVSLNNVYVGDSSIEGLNNGDKIVEVDGHFVNNYDKLALEMTVAGNENFEMTVKTKENKKKKVNVNPIAVGESNLIYGKDYGFSVESTIDKDTSKEVFIIKKSKIDSIKNESEIISINDEHITSYSNLLSILSKYEKNFTIEYIYNGEIKEEKINVKEKEEDTLLGYNYGFYITGTTEKGFFAAIKYAFLKFFSTIEQMIFTVIYLITGKISLGMLSGPVGIFNVVETYSQYGFSNIVSLLCLICINVGFINFLPLPAFDGGHILFIIIEKIKGSKVNPNQIMDALAEENIESRPIWKPMHLQPVYAHCDFFTKDGLSKGEKDCSVGVGDIITPDSVGADIFNRGLCLPSDIKNTEEDMEKIIQIIRALFE